MKKVLSFSLVALLSSGMNATAQTATGTITIQLKAGINIGTSNRLILSSTTL